MQTDLETLVGYGKHLVFLNYPYDDAFVPLADALSFAVVAGGMIPLDAKTVSQPDVPRLHALVKAISMCRYSAHDLSRCRGEGPDNLARMNMPVEMGMALYRALDTQRAEHRCSFFVSTPNDYKAFASDLAGLDPKCHEDDESKALSQMYEWLRAVVEDVFVDSPTADVAALFGEYKDLMQGLRGSGADGDPSHHEKRELMYQFCAHRDLWDFRKSRMGRQDLRAIPLTFEEGRQPPWIRG